MAIIKWKGKVYSFTVQTGLILFIFLALVTLSIQIIMAIGEFFAR